MKNQTTYFLNNCHNNKLATCCITGLLLAYSTTALAGYKPPRTQRPPGGYTSTTGTRGGCNSVGEASLSLLAPTNHVGQTASKYPTFAWFVPETKSLPMEFRLYKYGDDNQLQLQNWWKMQSQFGVMTLSLPENQPSLELGQRYVWQVAVLCDFNHPSNDLVATAEVDVVEIPSIINIKENAGKQVDVLAEAGLWYDALGVALKTGERNTLTELLTDLAALEKPEVTTVSTPKEN